MNSTERYSTPMMRSHWAYLSRFSDVIVAMLVTSAFQALLLHCCRSTTTRSEKWGIPRFNLLIRHYPRFKNQAAATFHGRGSSLQRNTMPGFGFKAGF
jgi:hypothetical protein